VLSAQAEELVVVKFELQELRKEYVSLQINLEEIQRRMSTQHDDLAAAQ
jgi:predicted  nucleic acid-binding Zn-ribbon protein